MGEHTRDVLSRKAAITMKSATKMSPTQAKHSAAPTRSAASSSSKSSSGAKKPLVGQIPQSKKQAAVQAGLFLRTDDSWSAVYFDANDLRCIERELFG